MSESDTITTTTNNEQQQQWQQPRGPYKRLERLRIQHQIESMLIQGFSNSYIQSRLGISSATYKRYKARAFKDEKSTLLGLDVTYAMQRVIESDRRFRELQDKAIKLSEDTVLDGDTRVSALSVALEVEKQRLILVSNGPQLISNLRGYSKTLEKLAADSAAAAALQVEEEDEEDEDEDEDGDGEEQEQEIVQQ